MCRDMWNWQTKNPAGEAVSETTIIKEDHAFLLSLKLAPTHPPPLVSSLYIPAREGMQAAIIPVLAHPVKKGPRPKLTKNMFILHMSTSNILFSFIKGTATPSSDVCPCEYRNTIFFYVKMHINYIVFTLYLVFSISGFGGVKHQMIKNPE